MPLGLSAPSPPAESSSAASGAAALLRPRLGTLLNARRRSVVLLSIVLDIPLVGRAVRGVTREPHVETLEVDGVPVEIVRPGRGGPRPAFLFVNGAHPLRREEPVVQRLSRGLARAGFIAIVPDLPGLGEGAITTKLPEALAAVMRHAIDLPDVRVGRLALVGASTGASLAVIAAARPEFAGRISLVAAVAPFANLDKMICLTTTGFYEEEAGFVRYEVSDLSRRIVARSLVASLDCEDREDLLAELSRLELEEVDPLEALPTRADLSPKARSVARLLGNRDPANFGALCAELPPELTSLMTELSPVVTADAVSAPVEVLVPPADEYFPSGEAAALADALPNVRLTVSHVLDHTRPSISLATLRDAAGFDRFVVRSLAVAGAK